MTAAVAKLPAIPGDQDDPDDVFWNCPRCVYRIAYDHPGGWQEPKHHHEVAHRLADRGLQALPTYGRLQPYLRR